jgi:hypothetical protein
MRFSELLQQRGVDSEQVVQRVRQRVADLDHPLPGPASIGDGARDFVRCYEPRALFSSDGRVEIRLLADRAFDIQSAVIQKLAVNDIAVEVEQVRTEPTPKTLPDGRAGMHVYITAHTSSSVPSSTLELRGAEAAQVVIKGQIQDGPKFAALGAAETSTTL